MTYELDRKQPTQPTFVLFDVSKNFRCAASASEVRFSKLPVQQWCVAITLCRGWEEIVLVTG